jgi:hypothetical protein
MSNNKKEEQEYEEYESLKQSRFKQQKLPGWRILPSMFHAILYFFSIGVLCLGIGIALILAAEENITYEEYFNNKTYVTFNISKKMKKDIMVYFKVYNLYQNNRRYAVSKSFDQLYGENMTLQNLKKKHDCDPIITNEDMGIKFSIFGEKLNESDLSIPCGLMAKSFKLFNNSYNFTLIDSNNNEQPLFINSTNIARKYDKKKYKNSFNMSNQWLNLEDEHFMVWMRPAPFANFSKLYGRINQDIEKGSVINVTIDYGKYFNKEEFNKSGANVSIIVTTINYFGGKNNELSFSFVGVGILCFIFGIIYILAFKCSNKKEK